MVTPHGWELAFVPLVAGVVGAIGGLVADLLQTRGTITGAVELPGRVVDDQRLLELGLWASVILGAAAAIAVLYFLPPTVVSNGETQYDVVKGIALALLAGSAGRTVLTSAQARLLASLKDQQARAAADVAATQIDRQAKSARDDVHAAVRAAMANQPDRTASALADEIAGEVSSRAHRRAADAKLAVAAIAPTPSLTGTPAADTIEEPSHAAPSSSG
jgi:hypothetical protein